MTAEVRIVEGRPELFLNGELASRMIARTALPGRYAELKVDQYEPAGIDVYMTETEMPNSLGWDGREGPLAAT